MFLKWLLAALHLLAFGIGSGAIWARTVALRTTPFDAGALKRALKADTFWGIAALLWLSTGLLRAFAGFEKGSAYYLHNHLFLAKMALFGYVVIIESRAAVKLGRWRAAVRRGEMPDTSGAPGIARTSMIEAHVLVVMMLLATAMARGTGG